MQEVQANVQKARKVLRLESRDFSELLDATDIGGKEFWFVAESYSIKGGWIRAEEGSGWVGKYVHFADPSVFLSFARLGARGEPSKASVLGWVKNYGLPRAGEGEGLTSARMKLADFRAEVLCAHQLLNLYTSIKTADIGALRAFLVEGKRHPVSKWPGTPPTIVERSIRWIREEVKLDLQRLQDVGFWELLDDGSGDDPPLVIIEVAHTILRENMKRQVAGIRLGFGEYGHSDPTEPLGDDYMLPGAYESPDLLSAAYLQFYLLITHHKPIRRCENPACGMPFPGTRRNKRFCNDTCRSNARHYR